MSAFFEVRILPEFYCVEKRKGRESFETDKGHTLIYLSTTLFPKTSGIFSGMLSTCNLENAV